MCFNFICAGTQAATNWQKEEMVGKGAFGQVFLCYDKDTGRNFAVKEVQLPSRNAELSKVIIQSIMVVVLNSKVIRLTTMYLTSLDYKFSLQIQIFYEGNFTSATGWLGNSGVM